MSQSSRVCVTGYPSVTRDDCDTSFECMTPKLVMGITLSIIHRFASKKLQKNSLKKGYILNTLKPTKPIRYPCSSLHITNYELVHRVFSFLETLEPAADCVQCSNVQYKCFKCSIVTIQWWNIHIVDTRRKIGEGDPIY